MFLLTAACSIHHELKATRLTSRRWIAFTSQIKRICHVIGKEKIHDLSSSIVLWEGGSSVSWYFSNMAWGPYYCMNMRQWYVTYTVGVLKGTEAAWCIHSPADDFTWQWHRLSWRKRYFKMTVKSSCVDFMNNDQRSQFQGSTIRIFFFWSDIYCQLELPTFSLASSYWFLYKFVVF